MSFEFNLTIPGIKIYKRKEAKEIHEETNAEGNIRVPHPQGHPVGLRAFMCVFTKQPR